jgi:hypothetical protein
MPPSPPYFTAVSPPFSKKTRTEMGCLKRYLLVENAPGGTRDFHPYSAFFCDEEKYFVILKEEYCEIAVIRALVSMVAEEVPKKYLNSPLHSWNQLFTIW